jgi:hypothetical protein
MKSLAAGFYCCKNFAITGFLCEDSFSTICDIDIKSIDAVFIMFVFVVSECCCVCFGTMSRHRFYQNPNQGEYSDEEDYNYGTSCPVGAKPEYLALSKSRIILSNPEYSDRFSGLKALTDHLWGGSIVYSFAPYWQTGGSAIFFSF